MPIRNFESKSNQNGQYEVYPENVSRNLISSIYFGQTCSL